MPLELIQQAGMSKDFSWKNSAQQYFQLYQRLALNSHPIDRFQISYPYPYPLSPIHHSLFTILSYLRPSMNFPRSSGILCIRPACLALMHRRPRPQPINLLIFLTAPVVSSGRFCRSAPPVTAIRLINVSPPSQAIPISSAPNFSS